MYNNIFDTHAHYDDEAFEPDREELLENLPKLGITNVITCGCDTESSLAGKELSDKYGYIYFAAGIHPENLEGASLSDIEKIKDVALSSKKCAAIGEIGLDYHWMAADRQTQIDFFRAQIKLAKSLDLPIIVHDREAHGDTLDVLREEKPTGVLHCFSGSKEMAKEIIKLGMYIGINGIATFKNARKSLETVREIPVERLLLETDCPYCAPEPKRGVRNDSSLIPYIAERLAAELNIGTQELLDITAENAKRLFKTVS